MGNLSLGAKYREIFSSFRSMRRTMPHVISIVILETDLNFFQFTFSSSNYFSFKCLRDTSIYSTGLQQNIPLGKGLEFIDIKYIEKH